MKLYLLNALIMPYESGENENAVFMSQKINIETYSNIIREAKSDNREIVPAFGHNSTVEFLKHIFTNENDIIDHFILSREMVYFEPGDIGLVCRVGKRGSEFTEWNFDELLNFYKEGNIEFYSIARIYAPEFIFDPSNYFKSEKEGI
jgi:hypothetical protein